MVDLGVDKIVIFAIMSLRNSNFDDILVLFEYPNLQKKYVMYTKHQLGKYLSTAAV